MAMTLQQTRLRLTQAKYFGHPPGGGGGSVTSVAGGNGLTPGPITAAGTIGLVGLTSDWNAGNKNINSRNSTTWYNIVAYGADPTGAADSTAAINSAIAAALVLGGAVYVPQGHYKVTSTIVLGAFGALATGLTIRGDAGAYQGPTSYAGSTFAWAGSTGTPMFWVKNFQDLVIDGIGLDGANVTGSTAILFDADGTAGSPTTRNIVRHCVIRRFHDGICVGSVTAATDTMGTGYYKDHPNTHQIDTLTLDKVHFSESIAGAEGAAIFLNCPNFTGSHFSNLNIWYWRYGVWVNGGAASNGGGFTMSDSVAGANGAITMDMVYCDYAHGLITLDNCEAEGVGASGHYIYVTAGAVATLYYPITIRNSNVMASLFAQQRQVLTEGCDIGSGFTFSNAASKWTSVSDSFNGTAPVVGGGTTKITVGTMAADAPLEIAAPRVSLNAIAGAGVPVTITDTTGLVINNGGALSLRGTDSAGHFTDLAAISAHKDNATSGQNGASLNFYSRYNGSGAWVAGGPSGPPSGGPVMTLGSTGLVGINNPAPTRTLDFEGVQRLRGIVAPAVSEANSATMYFDSGSNTLKASLNGSAYVNVIGSAGLTGSGVAGKLAYWSAASVLTDEPNITLGGAYALDVNGDINLSATGIIRSNTTPIFGTTIASGILWAGDTGPPVGNNSTAFGHQALRSETGIDNTGVGSLAGRLITTGTDNTVVGFNALNLTTTGGKNTALGELAGATNTTGSDNLFLGGEADAAAGNLTNAVAIGYQAVVASANSMQLGNASMKVGIRTGGTPNTALDVGGQVSHRMGTVGVVNGLNSNIATPDSSFVRLTGPTGGFSVGGFTGGFDGNLLTIYNTVAFQMTIVNEDGSSTALNRIKTLTGGNVVLRAGTSAATFQYDTTDDRWVLLNSN